MKFFILAMMVLPFMFWSCQNRGNVITIGAILPLTGDLASFSEPLKRGMNLAIEEINSKGGINGLKLQVIFEDDRGEPRTAISAYQKLVNIDNVPMIIGGMFSASTLAMAPLAQRDQIVLLSPTSSAIEITDAGDFIFRIYPSDIYDGIFLAKFAYDNLNARRIAIVYEQVASVVAIANKFRSEFESFGGEIVVFDGYNSDLSDFSSIIRRVSNANPDVVFIPGNLTPMANLLIQAKQLGFQGQFLTISTFYDGRILELAREAAEGVLFSSPMFDLTSDTPEMANFIALYRERYNTDPSILVGYGYDVVRIAALALQNGTTPQEIRNSLRQIEDFPGVTGNTTFDCNGDVSKELKIMTVKNGTFVPYIN